MTRASEKFTITCTAHNGQAATSEDLTLSYTCRDNIWAYDPANFVDDDTGSTNDWTTGYIQTGYATEVQANWFKFSWNSFIT